MKLKTKEPESSQADHATPAPMTARRGDSVVMTPDGKYVSVNGEPVDPDTGIPITRPGSVAANDVVKDADF